MAHNAIFRPVRVSAFPAEILSHVFLLLVEEQFDQYRFDDEAKLDYKNFVVYPWRLLEVCRGWRDVCLGNPVLWSYISLDGHDCSPEAQYDTAPFRRTSLQLKRSRDAPLYFDVTPLCTCRCEVARFRAVLANAHRWRMAIFCFSYKIRPEELRADSDFVRTLVPENLAFGSLKVVDCWLNNPNLSLPFNCSTLHCIRTATLHHLEDDKAQVGFPWSNLSTLILDDYRGNIQDLMHLLNECKGLARLEFNPMVSEGSDSLSEVDELVDGVPIAHLPHLASLILKLDDYHDLTPLLTYIKAPTLRTLDLDYELIQGKHIPALQAFLSSCRMTSTSLSLCHPSVPDADAEHFFLKWQDHCQHLQHLCLRGELGEECDTFLKVAARRDAEKGTLEILPHLEHLEIINLAFDPVLLSQMVAARACSTAMTAEASSDNRGAMLQSLSIQWLLRARDEDNIVCARYHTETTQVVLEEFVRCRRLKLETSIIVIEDVTEDD